MITSNPQSAMNIAKSVASYTLLPGFWSRLVGFVPRFGMIAYFMAIIFESLKLIPRGHKFLNPSTIKDGRIRDVLAVAANNLHGGFKNIDQYIVFGVFVLGTILIIGQFFLLMGAIVVSTADAAIPFTGMFITNRPQTDIAHLMMDKVFGIPAFFNSCFDPVFNAANAGLCSGYLATGGFPNAFQAGMQALFKFYSMGMLAIAGFVVVYYIFAMIVETVNTGVPFGQRFQSIFTPLRLVIAVLLMLPLAYGYNTGQYIVLLSAKWGSALATNSWLLFNNRVGNNPMGMQPEQLIGKPKVQDIESVLNYFYLVHTCRAAYALGTGITIKPYLIRTVGTAGPAVAQEVAAGTDFTTARDFFGQGDVKITFGEYKVEHQKFPSGVKPYCGEITMPALSKKVPGIETIYNVYFKHVRDIWFNGDMANYGRNMACILKYKSRTSCDVLGPTAVNWGAPAEQAAGQEFYIAMRQVIQASYNADMETQINTIRTTANPQIQMNQTDLNAGWGGAGLWFNKVMMFNGAFVDALGAMPTPTQYPHIMEHVAAKKRICGDKIQPKDKFSLTMPQTSAGKPGCTSIDIILGDSELGGDVAQNTEIASVLNSVYVQVNDSESTTKPKVSKSDSKIKNFVSLLFGQTGLFDFRANSEVFPLTKLSILGRELISKTILMIASTTLLSGAGSMIGAETGALGDVIQELGPSVRTFATIGLSLGILLYYVVPLMPFIYFFFAVGRWVKSIFEAMVAVPLWALAHLRLGGEGIPGPAAGQGYFLILEVFLRPILTLFGLMASIGSFMALTTGLDSVFNLAVMNVGGYDMTALSAGLPDTYANMTRDGMDALFYTVIYAILVYMIATSSFKLIDLFPNAIMRWGGTNTAGFNDQTEPIDQLEYNLVYKADAVARDITSTGQNFDDARRQRDMLTGK